VKYLCLLTLMMTTVILMAADPLGRVTSSGPLTLNGKAVPATAASSLPVVAGDEITTSGFLAMICFSDRSRATLEPNSRVKLEARSSAVALRVLSGSADLKVAEGSRLSLIPPVRPEPAKPAAGQFSSQTTVHEDSVKPPGPPDPHRPPPPRPTTTTFCSSAKRSLPTGSSALRLGLDWQKAWFAGVRPC
jgi:hypothetical protein